ncbi:hypothetical protein BdPhPhi1402_gp21 [Bdellovibrio phage phi1402]|uniref:hypothetical protein n=1 Tax=Bdellovibrio phage phi1402 TaxID=1035662 RepID=UPI000211A2D3|nr:hypothetical protein BdPhPhi1402_gp21 [Bdellovibrio phage phi1402]AEG42318.1 hypothetical protein [Bdellovibrio phage phi1402]
MNNILLDYFFPITVINPTPAASTAFLKQMCLVVKPKGASNPAPPAFCATMAEVMALTDNTEAQFAFNAGMSGLYIMTANELDLAEMLVGHEFDFYTLLISSDFSSDDIAGVEAAPAIPAALTAGGLEFEAVVPGAAANGVLISATGSPGGTLLVSVVDGDISVTFDSATDTQAEIVEAINEHAEAGLIVQVSTATPAALGLTFAAAPLAGGVNEVLASPAMSLGAYGGVVGVSGADDAFLESQAVIENRCAFKSVGNGAKNLIFAFGKLLSNTVNWANQQYVTMPLSDSVSQLGNAKNYFAKRISFVIDDKQYGKRLAFFGCGGKAIVAPYIVRNLVLDMQSAALTYVSANQPGYTKVHAALMEDELQKIITGSEGKPGYIEKGWITKGQVEIKLEQANFVASGYIEIAEPGALWRIEGQLKQTTT